jgi:hypothetical protein
LGTSTFINNAVIVTGAEGGYTGYRRRLSWDQFIADGATTAGTQPASITGKRGEERGGWSTFSTC